MTEPIEFYTPGDQFYRDMELRHSVELPVLGVPARFASNSPDVIGVVEEAFDAWRALEGRADLIEPEGVTITVVVQPGDEGDAEPEIYHRILGEHRVLFGSRGSIGYTDPARREATAFVTPPMVRARQYFRHVLIEGLTISVISPHDRQPFHASAVVRDGAAILLAGPSEVGKSTLAYAAARVGFEVLAEDTVYLQSRPRLRTWGLPGYLHLPADSRERFPELTDATPTFNANGKRKLAVDLRALDAIPSLPIAERATLCILSRGPASPGLERLDPDAVVDELMGSLEQGFDMFAATLREPLDRLAARGVWRLTLPEEPFGAVPWLDRLLDEVPAAP